jgi:hypothetical protein
LIFAGAQQQTLGSVYHPLVKPGIGIDSAVAQERPMNTMSIHHTQIDLCHDDLLAIVGVS